ncbi:MAG: 50S ribosomal protein L19 [Candidatus Schekmanbacteria bacterium]|nr:50S ribosomal protein L19 [Candidatus Schekmanbacteria bacterium]
MSMVIENLEQSLARKNVLNFRSGDIVKVHVKIKEGDKSRIQVYEGIVMRRRGRGLKETFTVRKVSYGVGVERIFPINSPIVDKIDMVREGNVRRACLYYLRGKKGKAAQVRAKNLYGVATSAAKATAQAE